MLFYCDPPYWGCEDDYGAAVFTRGDFERLAAALRAAAAKSIISINDTPEVRAIFAGFHQLPVETTYSIASAHGGAKRAGELLVSNFALPG